MSADRLGRYRLERKIAMGGMAEIWLAKQDGPAGFEKELVIKRILPHLADDEKFVGMFLDEARLAAQLTHPNIAQIFDLGEIDGSYFIAMEFIDGYDLSDIVERAVELGRAVPPAIAARIIVDACQALDYAHNFTGKDGVAIQLVHRDVSPQNILVARSGVVKLVDFGVAKAATSQHKTQTGAVKGKLSYMSPEQISGKPLDGRSDLFALGIVLYELVTAQRPFGHASELLAVTAILNEQPPSPRMLVQGVPHELENVIFGALEKDRDKRIPSARDMQLALEAVLRDSGALLSARDIGDYITDLFSDAPTHMPGQLAALAPTDVGQDLAAARLASVTAPSHPSASTRPDHSSDPTQPQPAGALSINAGGGAVAVAASAPPPSGPPVGPPAASVAAQHSAYTERSDGVQEAPSGRVGVWIAAVVASVLLLAVAAGLAWSLMGPNGMMNAADNLAEAVVSADTEESVEAPATPDAQSGANAAESDIEANAANAALALNTDAVAADGTEGGAKPPEGNDAGTGRELGTEGGLAASEGDAIAREPDAGEAAAESDAPEAQLGVAAIEVEPDAEVAVEADVIEALDVPPSVSDAGTTTPNVDPLEEQDPDEDSANAAEQRAVRPPADGRIQVRTSGGSFTVSIDGRRVGSLPGRNIFTVSPGRHTVVVESSDGTRFEERVTVDPGETERVRVR